MDIRIGKPTSMQLFKFFDRNGDGVIDLQEWNSTLASDSELILIYLKGLVTPAQFLSETMTKYNMTVNELFEKMGFGKSTYLLDRKMLGEGFRKLDSSLSEDTLIRYVESILDGNVFVELDDLSEVIDSQYVDKKIDTNWLAIVKSKLKFKLEHFSKYDTFISQLEVEIYLIG
jgi:EF hand